VISTATKQQNGATMKKFIALGAVFCLAGCASPEVVQVKQVGDSSMTCEQIKKPNEEAGEFEERARRERKVTGTNVAAAVFFWPALLATYANTDDAITAARDRQKQLTKISDEKSCKF
jgi:hypothetical protein